VALQEVDKLTARSGKVDQLKEIENITGMQGVFCRAIDFDGGEYGLSILSKYPVTLDEIIQLPSGQREQRIGCIINTHLDTKENPQVRLEQIRELNDRTMEMRGIKILLGDMNDVYSTIELGQVLTLKLESTTSLPVTHNVGILKNSKCRKVWKCGQE